MDSALDGASAWHGATAAPVMLRAFLDASAALAAILVVRYAVAYFGYFGVAADAAEESAEPEASSEPPSEPSEAEASGGGFLAPSLAQATERLRAHDVDPKRGFLPRRDPLRDLSKRYPQYQEWEWIGTSLPDLRLVQVGLKRGAHLAALLAHHSLERQQRLPAPRARARHAGVERRPQPGHDGRDLGLGELVVRGDSSDSPQQFCIRRG